LPDTSALTSLPGLGDEKAREDIQTLLTGYDRESDEDFQPSQPKPRRSTRNKAKRTKKRTTANSSGPNDELPPELNPQETEPLEDETQQQGTASLTNDCPWPDQPLNAEQRS
jgi:hypothetical protein